MIGKKTRRKVVKEKISQGEIRTMKFGRKDMNGFKKEDNSK